MVSYKKLAVLVAAVAVVAGAMVFAWASAADTPMTIDGPAQFVVPLASPNAVTVLSDNFDGTFPGTKWKLQVASGTPGWGQTTKTKKSGTKSIYCAKTGTGGKDWPGPYKPKQVALAISGPYSLKGKTAGFLATNAIYDLPAGSTPTDYLYLGVSVDGTHWVGGALNGSSAGAWKGPLGIDLTKVSTHPLGKTKVWFVVGFVSDASAVGTKKGVCVDDVIVQVQ